MTFRSTIFKNAVAGIAVTSAALTLGMSTALADTTLRLAIPDPAHSSVGRAASEFAKLVEEKTDGEVHAQIFADGVLFSGDQNAAINQLGSGALDGLVLASSVYASFIPQMNAISLPYLFKDYDELQAYLQGEPGQQLLSELDRLNIHGLGLFLRTFRDVTTRDTPITEMSDFEGLTLRTPNNPLFVTLFKSLGANPTPMAFSEVYSALQLKAIDGQENPVEVPLNNRFYEVQGQLNLTQHVADAFVLALSDRAWQKIPEQYRDEVQAAANEMIEQHNREEITQEQNIIDELRQKGMQVNELTPEAKEAIRKQAHGLYGQFEKDIGADFIRTSVDFVGK